MLAAANVHDGLRGARRLRPARQGQERQTAQERPDKLHADKGYDYPRCRRFLGKRDIKVRIARRGLESSERLGRWRWVVERTFSWMACYRRLVVRDERQADIHEAFLQLACTLICFNNLQRRF